MRALVYDVFGYRVGYLVMMGGVWAVLFGITAAVVVWTNGPEDQRGQSDDESQP